MVEYSKWVSIVRSTAERKGADLSDFRMNSDVVSVAADIWNEQKPRLKAASVREAKQVADEEVSVR